MLTEQIDRHDHDVPDTVQLFWTTVRSLKSFRSYDSKLVCGRRAAGMPNSLLRHRLYSTTNSASSSQPLNHLKVSVHTTTAGFSDETSTQKEVL